jgi:hypothetical protein
MSLLLLFHDNEAEPEPEPPEEEEEEVAEEAALYFVPVLTAWTPDVSEYWTPDNEAFVPDVTGAVT